jgi:hypothetical protein
MRQRIREIHKAILRWYYQKRPPSLHSAKKAIGKLNPGSRIVYYALYSDGCYTRGMYDGIRYFEGDAGVDHAPHLAFIPDDEPVFEWGIKGLRYGDTISKEQLEWLDSTTKGNQ